MEEVYKDIKNYEGLYKISNIGNVYSIRTKKILKPETTKYGYKMVMLTVNGKQKGAYIHRLVAEAFIPNPNNYPHVLHKKAVLNGGDNSIDNMYWGTPLDNTIDKINDGRAKWAKTGGDNFNARKIIQYDLNHNFIKKWNCIKDASDELKINREQISRVCRKVPRRNSVHGFIFEYAD